MIEPELKDQLEKINQNLFEIKKKTGGSMWQSLLHGIMSGIGSILGVAIALTIIGYILNTIGVIPAFRNEMVRLNATLDELRKIK